jgi:membrane associated rhomboid family serine protease
MSLFPSRSNSFRSPGGPRLPMRFWPAWRWLIIINVVIFFLDLFSGGRLTDWGAFSIEQGVERFQVWRWITFQFLHFDEWHILFNMLGLYFFSPMVEGVLGRRQFVIFFLICGLGGAAAFVALARFHGVDATLVGASAGIFGVLVAAAILNPNAEIRFAFTPISMTLKWFVIIYVGIAFIVVYRFGQNAGGEASHLGGAIVGFILMRNRRWLNVGLRPRPHRRFWKPGDPPDSFFRFKP